MIDVSVIIVNYNTLELTRNTIDSVIMKTFNLNYEIILIDNNSEDGSKEFFEENYKDKIIFIKNTQNIGFGRANNKASKIAKGKYLFFLNSDTLLINNAIKILFDFIEKNENVAVCGGNLYDQNMQPALSYKEEMLGYNSELLSKIKEKVFFRINKKALKIFNYTSNPKRVSIVLGADFMIRTKVFRELNGFDESFFMYHEESELCFRVLKGNYLIYNVPESKIIHLEGKSTKFKIEKFKMERQGKYLFFYKTKGKKSIKKAYILSQISYLLTLKIKKIKINREIYFKMKKEIEII